jgi:L-ascorbate 6-phosphate lactonase
VKNITAPELRPDQAALWFLGQAGYLASAGGVTLAIDPYLSDSVAEIAPDCARIMPAPIAPEELQVDIFIVTHDHLDHLDPQTIVPYRHKGTTWFAAPHLACRHLVEIGVPESRIRQVDAGQTEIIGGVTISGCFAMPTEEAVADTTGYIVTFPNGRSFYHSSDTAFCKQLLANPPTAEVLLVCINGKWGNLNVEEAVRLTQAVNPRIAIPNHYDMMAPNTEDPQAFVKALAAVAPDQETTILKVMDPFIWE